MKPKIHIITLGVDDLQHAMSFYRDGLGFPSEGIIGDEFLGDEKQPSGAIAMFKLEGGLILSLYPRTELAKDARSPLGSSSVTEFSIGHIVSSKEEVDQLLAAAKEAGATLTDVAHERPWGIYSGYFQDLDGHLWEVIYNPSF